MVFCHSLAGIWLRDSNTSEAAARSDMRRAKALLLLLILITLLLSPPGGIDFEENFILMG
jgi:hypothetical protein